MGGIDLSSLAGFDPASLVLANGHVCKIQPGVHCTMRRGQAALSSSHCAGRFLHCLLSCHRPLIVPLQRLVVTSPLDILLLRPLLVISSPRLLVALPLVVLLLCCLPSFSLCQLALLSFCCATLLASHCNGWSLSHLSLCCPLLVLLFQKFIALPLAPLLLFLTPLVATAVDVHPMPMPMRHLSCVNVLHTLP
jgi:hypothetical protein